VGHGGTDQETPFSEKREVQRFFLKRFLKPEGDPDEENRVAGGLLLNKQLLWAREGASRGERRQGVALETLPTRNVQENLLTLRRLGKRHSPKQKGKKDSEREFTHGFSRPERCVDGGEIT